MSATEVIDEIKSLLREEQEVVISFVQRLQQELAGRANEMRSMDPVKAKEISKRVFSEHSELFRKLAQ